MGAPVVHWEINAKDGRRAQEFYAGLFGWKVDANNPMNYGMINTGVKVGINGGIGQADISSPAPPLTFYIGVDDIPGCLSQVEAMGGRTVLPMTEVPGVVTYALFADPEGNVVGLVKNMAPARKPKPRKAKKAPKKKASKPKARKARRRR